MAQEGPAAHLECDGAKSEVEGSTNMLVDVHGDHGGANNDDGGEPVTVMDKSTKQ